MRKPTGTSKIEKKSCKVFLTIVQEHPNRWNMGTKCWNEIDDMENARGMGRRKKRRVGEDKAVVVPGNITVQTVQNPLANFGLI
jgi:hypothetical protein